MPATEIKAGQARDLTGGGDWATGGEPGHQPEYITDDAQRLVYFLWRGAPWGYVWTNPGKRTTWQQTGKPLRIPKGAEARDCYFGVHPTKAKRGQYERGRIQDVAAVNCLFADIDATDYGGDKAAALAHVETLDPAPSVIVDSGGGYHCYWLFYEPVIIENGEIREAMAELQAAWPKWAGGDSAASDLARVLRIPGTENHKDQPPRPVTILRADYDRLFDPAELAAVCRPHAQTQPPATPAPVRPASPHDDAVAVDPGGRIRIKQTEAPELGDPREYWLQRALERVIPHDGQRGRNATGLWLGCQLRDAGVSEGDARTVLLDYWAAVPQDRDRYSEAEALASVRQAYGRAPRDPAESQARRLKWCGRRGDRVLLRGDTLRYQVMAEDQSLAIRATAGQGRDHVDVILDRDSQDLEPAASAIAQGLRIPIEDARRDLAAIGPAIDAHPKPADVPPPENPESLGAFADWVNALLSQRAGRAAKARVSTAIRDWLLTRGRLLFDLATDAPYMLADDARALPLDDDGLALLTELTEAGINPTEPAFAWLLADLKVGAFKDGRRIRLARWARSEAGAVYISCGPLAYVLARPDCPLELQPNGAGGVVFAADASFPAWRHDAEPVDPLGLQCFKPTLTAPPEAPNYTPEVQNRLLRVLLIGLAAGLRPLPPLAALGDKDGGKSTLARAVLRLMLGPDANLGALSGDERDFWSMATGRPVFGLDNVDAEPAPWLPDALAVAATGGRRQGRELYTTGTISDRAITAAIVLTSRTATFARADVAERLLPILTAGIDDSERRADSRLDDEMRTHRDGALAYLAQSAANVLSWRDQAPRGLPARFLDFAALVWGWCRAMDQEAEAVPTLKAWREAQFLAVGEADPLLAAIMEFGDSVPAPERTNVSPSQLIRNLTKAGANIPFIGGGKAIARNLRELTTSLRLAGWHLEQGRIGEQAFVVLRRMRGAAAESAKSAEF